MMPYRPKRCDMVRRPLPKLSLSRRRRRRAAMELETATMAGLFRDGEALCAVEWSKAA